MADKQNDLQLQFIKKIIIISRSSVIFLSHKGKKVKASNTNCVHPTLDTSHCVCAERKTTLESVKSFIRYKRFRPHPVWTVWLIILCEAAGAFQLRNKSGALSSRSHWRIEAREFPHSRAHWSWRTASDDDLPVRIITSGLGGRTRWRGDGVWNALFQQTSAGWTFNPKVSRPSARRPKQQFWNKPSVSWVKVPIKQSKSTLRPAKDISRCTDSQWKVSCKSGVDNSDFRCKCLPAHFLGTKWMPAGKWCLSGLWTSKAAQHRVR